MSRKTLIHLTTRSMVLLLIADLAQDFISLVSFMRNGNMNIEGIRLYANIANINIEVELAAIFIFLVLPPILLTTLPGDEAIEKELVASDLLIVILRTIGLIVFSFGVCNALPPYFGINETPSTTTGTIGIIVGLLAFGFASQISNLLLPPPPEPTQ
ncbi:MAG: hypothetical protein ACKVQS_06755 [Fimbriimonadaceae bacterium]